MKLFLMPDEPSWWVWTVTAVLLAFGISGHPEFFLVAIALSVMQTFFFLNRERAFAAYSVQIRVACTLRCSWSHSCRSFGGSIGRRW